MAQVNTKALKDSQNGNGNGNGTGNALKNVTKDYAPTIKVIQNARMMTRVLIDNTIGRFDPNVITMQQRDHMRRDPMIALGLHYIRMPLLNAEWSIECEDQQIAAFVENALKRIYTRLLTQMLTSLDYGYAAIVKEFEAIEPPDWKYQDADTMKPKPVWPSKNVRPVVWNDFRILPPYGAQPYFGEDGKSFQGIRHLYLNDQNNKKLEVPASHSLWVTNEREETFGDWYGYPRTGYAVRYWWSYWWRWLLGDRHFEQDADPPLLVGVPANEMVTNPDDPTGPPISAQDLGLKIGQMLRDGSTIAIPTDLYENVTGESVTSRGARKWTAEFLKGGENMKAYNDSFEYLDVMKLRSILVPEQALVEGKGGTSSRNVAATYGELFASAQEILMGQLDQIINDYLIPDLLTQNFVNPPTCRKVTTGFRDEDMSLVTQLITTLATQDASSLHLDTRELVKQAGLPLLTPEEEEAQKQEMLDQQQQFQPNDPNAPPVAPGAAPGAQGNGAGAGAGGAAPSAPSGGSGVTLDGQAFQAGLTLDGELLTLGSTDATVLIDDVPYSVTPGGDVVLAAMPELPDAPQWQDDEEMRALLERLYGHVEGFLAQTYDGVAHRLAEAAS